MTPAASWLTVALVLCPPVLLLYCALRLSGIVDREVPKRDPGRK